MANQIPQLPPIISLATELSTSNNYDEISRSITFFTASLSDHLDDTNYTPFQLQIPRFKRSSANRTSAQALNDYNRIRLAITRTNMADGIYMLPGVARKTEPEVEEFKNELLTMSKERMREIVENDLKKEKVAGLKCCSFIEMKTREAGIKYQPRRIEELSLIFGDDRLVDKDDDTNDGDSNMDSSLAGEIGTLGILSQNLPRELIDEIVLQMDVLSARTFSQVSRSARLMVFNHPAVKTLCSYTPNQLAAMIKTKLGACICLGTLMAHLHSDGNCVSCEEFGPYLFLPTGERACFTCLLSSPHFQVHETLEVQTAAQRPYEFAPEEERKAAYEAIDAVLSSRSFTSIAVNYGFEERYVPSRRLIAASALRNLPSPAFAYFREDRVRPLPVSSIDIQFLLKDHRYNRTFLACVSFPIRTCSLTNPARPVYDLGISCHGCRLYRYLDDNIALPATTVRQVIDEGSDEVLARKCLVVFSTRGFEEHLLGECEAGRKLWVGASLRGQLKDTSPEFYSRVRAFERNKVWPL